MPIVVYSYLRFSTLEQKKGDSLRRQIDARDAYIKAHGLRLDQTLTDEGLSGYSGENVERGALGRFLDAIQHGSVSKGSILIVESMDRLSRLPVMDAFDLFSGILRAGVDIITLFPERHFTRELLNANPFEIFGVIAEMMRGTGESKIKSERCRQAWAEKRKQASQKPMTSTLPSWLELSEGAIQPIPEKVRIVQRIYKLALDGYGAFSIARIFNSEKVPILPTRRTAKDWQCDYIKTILRTRAVLGEFQPFRRSRKPTREPIAGYYPQIISESDWHKVQSIRAKRAQTGGRHGQSTANLFTSLVRCVNNDTNMVRVGKTKTESYLASSDVHKGGTNLTIPYQVFEDAVLSSVSEITLGKPNFASEINAIESELKVANSRLSKLKRSFKLSPHSDALIILILETEKEIVELSQQKKRLNEQPPNAIDETLDLLTSLKNASASELGMLRMRLKTRLRGVIDRILVGIAKEGVHTFASIEVQYREGTRRTLWLTIRRGKLSSLDQSPKKFPQSQPIHFGYSVANRRLKKFA